MREYNIQLAQSLMAWAYDFKTRYHQTWSFQLVEKRIQVIRDALALMAGELPNPPTVMERIPDQEFATVVTGWVELASALDDRYKHIGQLQDLEEQICILLRTLGAVSDDPKKAILTKRELGAALRTRFDHLGNITDIQDALVLHSSLLDQVNAGQLGYHWLLYELGCTLYNRFTRFGDDDDLTRCVAMQTEAIEIFPASDPWRFLPQRILAAALWTSYRRSGELSYLNNASSLLLDILHTQPSNHRDRYQTYHTLSSCKESLFRQCGDMADLDEAIACSRQALSLQDSRHPARLRSLNNLAGMLRSRHFYLGAIADVEESITLLRQGLGLPGQGDERASALYQLATGYKGRYEALGQLDDLDESIRLLREALDLRPSGHPGRAPILNGLGRAVQMRYRIYRRVDDSVEAIHLYRSALGLYSRNNTNYVGTVFNLVEALSESYGGYHQEDCLEEAIVLCETWLAGSQDEERSLRGWFLHTFAKALSLRYERHHCTEDLTTAILRCKDALFFLPAGYMIHRCYSFVQLADMLRRQYEITHAPEDARRAAKSLTDALACLPEGHPERATALFEFARLRLVPESPVFDKSSALEMLARAVSDGRQNAQTRLASALDVLKHVERHVSVSQPDPQLQQALLDVYTRTVELLPRVAYFGLDVESRLRALANSDKVAADGAAHALLLAQPEFAIELLELGRAVFWSQQLRLRTAFSALPSELAAKLTQAAFMLERGSHCAGHTVNENQAKAAQEIQTANRRRLGDDFEELIAQARALPGFERFMLPEPFRALCTAAAHGPVVVLLANDIACQAIVLETPESVHQVQLPKAYLKTLKTLSRAMSIAVRRGRGLLRNRAMKKLHVEGGRKAEQVLEELWRNVILRVINVLDARVRVSSASTSYSLADLNPLESPTTKPSSHCPMPDWHLRTSSHSCCWGISHQRYRGRRMSIRLLCQLLYAHDWGSPQRTSPCVGHTCGGSEDTPRCSLSAFPVGTAALCSQRDRIHQSGYPTTRSRRSAR